MVNESEDFESIRRINAALEEIRHYAASIPDYPDVSWLQEASDRSARIQKGEERKAGVLHAVSVISAYFAVVGYLALFATLTSSPDLAEIIQERIGTNHDSGAPLVVLALCGGVVLASALITIFGAMAQDIKRQRRPRQVADESH